METRLFGLCMGLFLLATLRASCADPTYVRFNTTLGNIDVEMLSDPVPNGAPNTVANFLTYVDSGAYNNSIIHRSVPGFIIQGGGYDVVSNNLTAIPLNRDYTANPLVGESGVPNTRGTIAMALTGGPDTGSDQWFFNEVDNTSNLAGGPFTVFGVVANASSLAIMDQIANVPVPNPGPFGPPFDEIPLLNYTTGNSVQLSNLVFVNSITRLVVQNFVNWESESTHFTTQQLNTPSISGPSAIPQNDGVPNLFKYLYNIDPSRPMTAADRAALATVGSVTISGTKYLTLTYRQYVKKIDVTVNIQTSPDLQTWTTQTNLTPLTSPALVQIGTDSTTNDPIMQVQVPISGAKQFIRLNVTQP